MPGQYFQDRTASTGLPDTDTSTASEGRTERKGQPERRNQNVTSRTGLQDRAARIGLPFDRVVRTGLPAQDC
jgi:hypothetical protein